MQYLIKRPEDFKTTHWSGGTTTELYIFPEGANFSDRQFDFRLSIAIISIGESAFTPLSGVDRTLLLLEGELELIHEGHHRNKLMPLMQDSFKGDWSTKCLGTGTDFNLMTQNCKGTISVFQKNTELFHGSKHGCFYCLHGNTTINNIKLDEGNFIKIDHTSEISLQTNGIVIYVEVD